MESLNLNTLANSLPNAQQNAEKELLNDFKGAYYLSYSFKFFIMMPPRFLAAALSITTLYRSSRKNSKRAYNAGYAAACRDLLNFIQQGVSASDVGSPSDDLEGGMTIGKVMDWTEARVDAIKAREEEEDEDEEREKDKDRPPPPSAAPSVAVHVAPKSEVKKSGVPHRPKDTAVGFQTLLSKPLINSFIRQYRLFRTHPVVLENTFLLLLLHSLKLQYSSALAQSVGTQ